GPLHALAGGTQLDLYARCVVAVVLVFSLGQPPVALASGEDGRGDVLGVAADRVERLREAPLHRFGQLVAQLLELVEARLEVGPLRDELLEPLLLRCVLLVRERVDLAQRLAPPLEPLDGRRELLGVVAFRRLVYVRRLEAPTRLVGLR